MMKHNHDFISMHLLVGKMCDLLGDRVPDDAAPEIAAKAQRKLQDCGSSLAQKLNAVNKS